MTNLKHVNNMKHVTDLKRVTDLELLVGEPAVLVRVGVVEHLVDVLVSHRDRQVPHQVPEILLQQPMLS